MAGICSKLAVYLNRRASLVRSTKSQFEEYELLVSGHLCDAEALRSCNESLGSKVSELAHLHATCRSQNEVFVSLMRSNVLAASKEVFDLTTALSWQDATGTSVRKKCDVDLALYNFLRVVDKSVSSLASSLGGKQYHASLITQSSGSGSCVYRLFDCTNRLSFWYNEIYRFVL